MSTHNEGLLTEVATAIGATLGRVARTSSELVHTAERKISNARPKKRARKAARRVKTRLRATARRTKKAARKASTAAKKVRRTAAGKARRALRAA